MSLGTVQQLYADVEKIASKSPGHFSDDSSIALFVANLKQAQEEHPNDQILNALQIPSSETKWSDLLIRIGQLKAALLEYQELPISFI